MMDRWLIVAKPFVFLGPAEFEGPFWAGLGRSLARVVFVLTLAFALTWMLVASPLLQAPTRSETERILCEIRPCSNGRMVVNDASIVDRLKVYQLDPARIAIEVRDVEATAYPPSASWAKAMDYDLVATVQGAEEEMLLATVRHIWLDTWVYDLVALLPWPPEQAWPFRQVEFYAPGYSVSSLLLDSSDTSALSARDLDSAREVLDPLLRQLPSAQDVRYSWSRRLTGPIQYATYFLFWVGVVLLSMQWIVNIQLNSIVRDIDLWHKREERSAASIKTAENVATEDLDADALAVEVESANETTTKSKIVTFPSPWPLANYQGNVETFINTLEEIRNLVRSRAGWLGAVPSIPLLDIKITGFFALRAARTGENLPSFVAFETETAAERIDAHHRLVTFAIWSIPTVGFVGTVVGIGESLLVTLDIQSAFSYLRSAAEGSVAVAIGVAFDTTLVALLLSFVLMLFYHLVQRGEDQMLSREKRDALRDLLNTRNTPAPATGEDLALMLDRFSGSVSDFGRIQGALTRQLELLAALTAPEAERRRRLPWTVIVLLAALAVAVALLSGYLALPS